MPTSNASPRSQRTTTKASRSPEQGRNVRRMAEDELAQRLVNSLNATYGRHAGHRAAHARGVLCSAMFTPTAEAARLSRAEHFAGGPVRAHVRFSNGSGDPTVPDGTRDGR